MTLPAVTPAEMKILLCLLSAMAPKRIAEQLCVSEHTVRTHIKRLHAKFGTHSVPELILTASRKPPQPPAH